MARTDPPAALDALRSAKTPREQLAALKQLKNDIIGHEQRKEIIIQHGVVEHLVRSLVGNGTGNARGKRRSTKIDTGGAVNRGGDGATSEWELGHQIRLQGVFIVTSLAHAGSPFIAPLIVGGVLPPLLSSLSPGTVPPRLTVEILRAIAVMAESLRHDPFREYGAIQETFANQIFCQSTTDHLAFILSQAESSQVVDNQLSLVMQIIRYSTGNNSKYQRVLVTAGILDLLASRLAALISKSYSAFLPHDHEASFLPPPPRSSYCDLLEAIAAIVYGSTYRSARLFHSRDILAIFPTLPNFPTVSEPYASFPEALSTGLAAHPWDRFLPKLAKPQNKSELSHLRTFPPLGSFVPIVDGPQVPFANDTQNSLSRRGNPSDDLNSDLVAWMVHMIRSSTGYERLSTIWLLAVLLNATDLNIQCERPLSLLVVPLLVRLIEDSHSKAALKDQSHGMAWTSEARIRAPHALSLLIRNSAQLQNAAVGADAIKYLCPILKKTFDPVVTVNKPMWSPYPQSSNAEPRSQSDPCMLGPPVMASLLLDALYCRAYTMLAISALAEKEDSSRKEIIKNGVVLCLVDALTPFPERPTPNALVRSTDTIDARDGNPDFVLAAALRVITALSRSVSILRTSLIDGGIAKPVFALFRHTNIDVKRAATDSLVNLILHFSPMRNELMNFGVLRVLCEHAHSMDMELRVSALWALKHLITGSSNEIKLQAYEELGTGFLAQILSGDSSASPSGHLATPNALGEKVSLLNSVDEPAMDIDSSLASSDEDPGYVGSLQRQAIREKFRQTEEHASRLRPIRNAEQSPTIRQRRDDVRLQYHTLDFLRNMLAEPTAMQPEIVDHIMSTMGTARFFDVIVTKLKPRSGPQAYGGYGSTAGKRPTLTTPGGKNGNAATQSYIDQGNYNPPDILHSALFILVHVANGRPSHRHLVLSQPQLLTTLLPLFAHPEPKVRVACVWLAHNVLWVEDSGDSSAARQRASELRVSGIEDKCRDATRDADLDTRERAKAVVEAFGKLLDGVPASTGPGRSGVWDR